MTDSASAGNDLNTLTPTQAAQKLDTMTADKAWSEKFLSGDLAAKREFETLTETKLKADRIDAVLAGTAEVPAFEITPRGEVSTRNLIDTVGWLKEQGISENVLRAFLTDAPVPADDRQAVDRLFTHLKSDAEFVKRYLGGDTAAREVMTKIIMGRIRPIGRAGE